MNPLSASDAIMSVTFLTELGLFILMGKKERSIWARS
jgi:hypothetical protein